MNKLKRQQRINSCLQLVDKSFKLVPNYVKPHKGNSDTHEIAKFRKCLELMRDGKTIYTEVRFKNGLGRCDILVPEDFRVYEIVCTETEKESLSKLNRYPSSLDIIFIKTNEV